MTEFGTALKEWRGIRRLSQLELGLQAGVSSRHISFLETGRSRPSRGMVLRLCDELHIPGEARNTLLVAAGLAPAYQARPAGAEELAPLRQAVDWMLQQHAPFPALALDRHWGIVAMNAPAELMFRATGVQTGDSLIDAFLDNPLLRAAIVNLEEVQQLSLSRLRTELAHFGKDEVIEQAVSRLRNLVGESPAYPPGAAPVVIPARYRIGDQVLSFFSTITQFGATTDIAMSELRIEMFFAADTQTRDMVFAMAGQG
jgi:transcriptional regulator with XRE-family HTH domain